MDLTLKKKLKVNLDLLLVQRKMTLTELSNKVDRFNDLDKDIYFNFLKLHP